MFEKLMPHSHCFLWAKELVPYHVMFNIIIGISYLCISGLLVFLFFKKREYDHAGFFILFGAFILACGLGHFLDAYNMYHGRYILETLWHGVTAFVSFVAAATLVRHLPRLINAPKINHLAKAIELSHKLKGEEKVLRGLVSLATVGYWEWHVPSGYDFMSESWHNLLGYEVGELEHHVSTWENLMHPDDLPKARKAMQEHFDSKGKVPYILYAKYKHKDGHWVELKDVGKCIEWDKEGNPITVIGYETPVERPSND